MIIICHNDDKISKIITGDSIGITISKATIAENLMDIAERFPDEMLVWCHTELYVDLDIPSINGLFHQHKMMFSYQASGNYLGEKIGYVEESIFIKVNKAMRYPTWQMSSDVGAISAKVLNALVGQLHPSRNFDYFLNSLAKVAMPHGLLCYSEPKLLHGTIKRVSKQAGGSELFRFVKQHYRTRWIFLLLLNLFIYENRLAVWPFFKSLFFRKRGVTNQALNKISAHAVQMKSQQNTFDVLIPTIGRKVYLYDVLLDLKSQTHLPDKVIIIEQNPKIGAETELDFLTTESWPFKVNHIFTHQTGACNARNLGLANVSSEWVFFADDDIKLAPEFLENALNNIQKHGVEAVSVGCYQKGDIPKYNHVFQWPFFGSGCSIVRAASLTGCRFQMGYEFGFGEDADFGMQLRNKGCDILFLPQPDIIHLKAPIGGFRVKPSLAWENDLIKPKPSPTVMLFMLSHYTQQQLAGYKTNLFFKFYKHQSIRNPFRYYRHFRKQWDKSVFWANQLKIK